MLPNQYPLKKHQRWRCDDSIKHTYIMLKHVARFLLSPAAIWKVCNTASATSPICFFVEFHTVLGVQIQNRSRSLQFTKHKLLIIKIYRITSAHCLTCFSISLWSGPVLADYRIPHYERQMFCQCKHSPPYLSEAAERFVSV